jgi:hypothetical protein
MKHVLKTAGLVAFAGMSSLAIAQTYTPNLMTKGANISVLNAQNFGDNSYRLPVPNADTTQIRVNMKGYVFGFRVIRSDLIAQFDDRNYAAYTDAKSSGLAALLKKMEIWAVTRGTYDRGGLRPDWHVIRKTAAWK